MGINPYEAPQFSEPPVPLHAPNQISLEVAVALAGAQFGIGLIASFLLWALSAPREAWDVNPYYSAWLFTFGIISALPRPRTFYAGVAGIYSGQVAAIGALIPVQVPILFPALAVLLLGTLPAVAGGLLGVVVSLGVTWAIRHLKR
jgi:hypothetical protein